MNTSIILMTVTHLANNVLKFSASALLLTTTYIGMRGYLTASDIKKYVIEHEQSEAKPKAA